MKRIDFYKTGRAIRRNGRLVNEWYEVRSDGALVGDGVSAAEAVAKAEAEGAFPWFRRAIIPSMVRLGIYRAE
jgi:hypothetical protein